MPQVLSIIKNIYRTKKSYYEIRNFSDKLCKEYNLSVVIPGQNKGKSYVEYTADNNGGSWKSKLKIVIDNIIPHSTDFEDFLKRLELADYEIKRGKYISVRAPGQERFTRTKTLGVDYTEEAITKRIAGIYIMTVPNNVIDMPIPAKSPKNIYTRPAPAVNLIIDIENCVKAQQNVGFVRWQKIQNLKEAAKTLNFLTENNLLHYSSLANKTAEVAAAFDTADDTLKTAEKRLADMEVLMKHISNYQQTKSIYDGLKTTKNKIEYRREHESDIILHEAAARALHKHKNDDAKLPNLAMLQAEYARLVEKKNTLHVEYGNLKRQSREYGIVKKNVDSILNPNMELSRGKERSAEL